jgi:hypothetical protein
MNDLDRRSEDWSADDAAYEPGWYALANRAPVSEDYQVFHPKASHKAEPPRRGLDELLELLVGSADPDTRRTAAEAAIGLIQGIGIDEGSFDRLLVQLGRADGSDLPGPDTLSRLGEVIGSHRLKTALDLPDERRVGAERLLSVNPADVPSSDAGSATQDAVADPNELRAREAALDRREASLIEREAAVLEREAALQEREVALRQREAVLAHPAGEPVSRGAPPAEPESALSGSRFHRQRAG